MKLRLVLATLSVVVVAALAFAASPKELEIGAAAPRVELKMKDVSGMKLSLADVKGRGGLLVIFSCNTCPYVIAWEDRYAMLATKCDDLDIGLVAVNSNSAQRAGVDSFEAMREHATKQRYAFPYVMDEDGALADAFGANRTPHVFLFDANMHLVYRGAIDDNYDDASKVEQPYLLDAIDALAAGREVAVKTTKSIGCTIKRK